SAPPPVVVRRPASGNATDDEGSGGDGGGDALPEGYVTIPRLGSAYRYHDDWLMWSDARAACEAEGGHLAVPGSEEEYNALAKLSSKHPRAHRRAKLRALGSGRARQERRLHLLPDAHQDVVRRALRLRRGLCMRDESLRRTRGRRCRADVTVISVKRNVDAYNVTHRVGK
ncbi:Hemolymph lipopolysaccharide-binding protein, partial [Gryllus bimaculatus]